MKMTIQEMDEFVFKYGADNKCDDEGKSMGQAMFETERTFRKEGN